MMGIYGGWGGGLFILDIVVGVEEVGIVDTILSLLYGIYILLILYCTVLYVLYAYK